MKKPKAEGDGMVYQRRNSADDLNLSSSAGKFEDRIRELEDAIRHGRYEEGLGMPVTRARLEGLKEGYSLGKQDRNAELIKAVSELKEYYFLKKDIGNPRFSMLEKRKVLELLKANEGVKSRLQSNSSEAGR